MVNDVLCLPGYPQGLILQELAKYILSDAVQKPMKGFYFAALPEKVRCTATFPHCVHTGVAIDRGWSLHCMHLFQVLCQLTVVPCSDATD